MLSNYNPPVTPSDGQTERKLHKSALPALARALLAHSCPNRGDFEDFMLDRMRHTFVMASLAWAVGCISPTLPLPPPNRPAIDGPDAGGEVTLSGSTKPSAFVYADNLDTGQSAGERADEETGSYQFKLGARVGDTISLFYRYGTDESLPVAFVIPQPREANAASGSADGGAGAGGVAAGGAGGVAAAGGGSGTTGSAGL